MLFTAEEVSHRLLDVSKGECVLRKRLAVPELQVLAKALELGLHLVCWPLFERCDMNASAERVILCLPARLIINTDQKFFPMGQGAVCQRLVPKLVRS